MTAPQAVPQAVVMTDAPAVLRRASRRGARGPGHRVGPWDLFCAELLRSQRTFTWGVVAVTAVFTLQTIRLSHASIGQGAVLEVAWNGNALAWMHLYPAGFAVSLGLLVGVMAQWREERWRQGGAAWRAVAPRRVLVARLAVMWVSALACQVALIAPVVLDALLAGNGWGPWRNYLLFGLFMWMVVAGASAWGVVAYRVAGVAAVGAAPIMGLVWSLAGATQAERDDWWMWPWAWCARPPLSLLGVHGNSVLLEAGSPVWDYPLLPGFLLTAALGAAGAAIALLAGSGPGGRSRPRDLITGGPVAVGRAGSGGQSDRAGRGPEALVQAPRDARARRAGGLDARAKVGAAVANGSGLRSAVAGLAGVLPWTLWSALGAVFLGVVLVVRAVYSPDAALGLLELAGLPLSAAVMGITTWGSVAPAWRSLLLRCGPARLLASLILLQGVFLVPVLTGIWLVARWGEPLVRTDPGLGAIMGSVYALAVMPAVALMVVSVSMSVAMCARPVSAIAVNGVLLLSGLIIGGNDVLARTSMWLSGPWGWMRVAHSFPQYWLSITVLGVLAAVASLAIAWWRASAVAVRE